MLCKKARYFNQTAYPVYMWPFRKKARGAVLRYVDFDIHWDTEDPFIFVSHHRDNYPKGNSQQAPPYDMIAWRDLGHDYKKHNGFRMYKGKVVPGFPMHPHWGYETFTIVEEGYVDTFDSEGNQSRFGFGDAQWVTASSKYQHSEMYPLVFQDRPNPNNITQIMINLPLERKGSTNDVNMVWSEDFETKNLTDGSGKNIEVILYAGTYEDMTVGVPNPNSWAADPDNRVKILQIKMEEGAEFVLKADSPEINRNLYFVSGSDADVEGFAADAGYRMKLKSDIDITIRNGEVPSKFWLLDGRPIKQKMTSYGPVVLDNDKTVRDAMNDIRKYEYEIWPWNVIDKVQSVEAPRFIRYADGKEEYPDGKPEGFEPAETGRNESYENDSVNRCV
jgi:redox-sensitive bicupin YhaK (pirin superfamily)